jgi:ATP phosphoribosyltransferase
VSRALIAESGVELEQMKSALRAPATNYPLEALFLRDDDIPGYCAEGIVDAAIVGLNVVLEQRAEVRIVRRLGFARCRLAIAVPKGLSYYSPESLNGLTIATSYPNLLADFLERNGVRATITSISGSVEVAPSIGLGDAICDLVSSGSTLLSNGLVEVETILSSEAVLIAPSELVPEKQLLIDKLLFRIDAVLRAKRTKYISLNAPNSAIQEIVALLPGLKSPSILPLATEGWSSVHTVVGEDDFWNVIDQLRLVGAQGILEFPIEKVIV